MLHSRKTFLLAIALVTLLLTSTAAPAESAALLWGDYTTDEDNEQNAGWNGADGDLDGVYGINKYSSGKTKQNFTPPADSKFVLFGDNWYFPYVCDSDNVAPIEFDIFIPNGTINAGGKLSVFTYWVRPGEYAVVYLNGQYMGPLTPTGEKQFGETVFDLPTDSQLVNAGRDNRVTVMLKNGACTAVTGGTIHLVSPRGTIRGLVFLDENRNGIWDEGEKGFPGINVHFFVDGREVVEPELKSGDDGTYGLVQAEWGDYMVSIDTPEGYVPTSPTSQTFHWENIDAFVGVNFGIATVPPPTPTPSPTPENTATPTLTPI